MTRLILITFACLGWAWFELSGGMDFVPGETGVRVLATYEPPAQTETRSLVARADTSAADLSSVAPAKIETASAVHNRPALTTDTEKAVTLTVAGLSEAEPRAFEVAAAVDYRAVSGSRVNLRGGPGTSFDVITQLRRGNEVEVLVDDGDGWVKLRALDGNHVGWMSDSFLTAIN